MLFLNRITQNETSMIVTNTNRNENPGYASSIRPLKNKLFTDENLKKVLYETSASFFFVFFYFVLIDHALWGPSVPEKIIFTVTFMIIYFSISRIFLAISVVHILPLISFIELLNRENPRDFIFRLSGQFLGAFVAILVYSLGIKYEMAIDSGVQTDLLHPFLTGLFTGFLSQIIYFLYYFIIIKPDIGKILKCVLFSAGLGFVFFWVLLIGNISLLIPFGTLFHDILSGNQIKAETVLTGSMIYILVPVFFVAGTHSFMTGFILNKRD